MKKFRTTLFFRASASYSKFWMIKVGDVTKQRSQHESLGGKMFNSRRKTLFCLGYRLSKHKMTLFSKNLGAWSCWPIPGYVYGVTALSSAYNNREMCKTNWGSKITNWINICPFMLKRCVYCMILITFHSQYIWICVFLQVRGKSRREAATVCASFHWVAFALSSLS